METIPMMRFTAIGGDMNVRDWCNPPRRQSRTWKSSQKKSRLNKRRSGGGRKGRGK